MQQRGHRTLAAARCQFAAQKLLAQPWASGVGRVGRWTDMPNLFRRENLAPIVLIVCSSLQMFNHGTPAPWPAVALRDRQIAPLAGAAA
jgi:hypothetical protein